MTLYYQIQVLFGYSVMKMTRQTIQTCLHFTTWGEQRYITQMPRPRKYLLLSCWECCWQATPGESSPSNLMHGGPFLGLWHSTAECGEGTWTTVMATYAPEHPMDLVKASSELYYSSPSPTAQSYFLFSLPQRLTTNPCLACHNLPGL